MPRLRPLLLTLALLASSLALPASAAAQQTTAPPGNSAIDEYLETVPGVGGDERPRPQTQGGPAPAGGAALDAAQRAELQAQGADGASLAKVVEATAPASRPQAGSVAAAQGTGQSPVAAALAATTGSDERSALGPLLPAILLVSLLGVVALVLARRRGRT